MKNKNEIADLAANTKEMTTLLVQFIAANKQQQQQQSNGLNKTRTRKSSQQSSGPDLKASSSQSRSSRKRVEKGKPENSWKKTRTVTKRVKCQIMPHQ